MHSRWFPPVLAVLAVTVFAVVLDLTSYMNFYYDEWDSIAWRRAWRLDVFLWPHNEHWSTIPVLLWKSLFVVFGIGSHLPYEGAVLVAHVASVFLLFLLIRRRSGDLPAFAASLTLLVLGSGGSNIVWAFQVGFVGSVAFGLLAMLLVMGKPSPVHVAGASAALLCSLMCSSVGLAFFAAFTAQVLLEHGRRRYLIALVVPAAAFVAWYLAFDTGRIPGLPGTSASLHHGPLGWPYIASLISFLTYGLEATAAGLSGSTGAIGLVILLVLVVVIGFRSYQARKVYAWQMGMAAGVIAWFVLTGLGRAQNGSEVAGDSHYLYVGAIFLLPLIADVIKDLPWQGVWRPLLAVVFGFALYGNIVLLWDYTRSQVDTMQIEDAELQTVEFFRGAPDMAIYRQFDNKIMPQLDAARYFPAIDQLGSPVPSPTNDTLRRLPPSAVDTLMVNLFGPALSVTTDPIWSTQGLACQNVDSTGGSTIDLSAVSGASVGLRSSKAGTALFYLSLLDAPPAEPVKHVDLASATQEWVHLPNTGKAVVWHLRVKTPAVGVLQVCGASSLDARDSRVHKATAFDGWLGPGWTVVPDPAASSGRVARARAGSIHVVSGAYANDTFGPSFVPAAGTYDLWFRVKVANPSGATPEMTLGLWDEGGSGAWNGSTTYSPNMVGTDYVWIKAASAVVAAQGHAVQFQATVESQLSTDWFIDEAVLTPFGQPHP